MENAEYGLSGYLSPDGTWYPCGYHEHGEKAREITEIYKLDLSDSNLIAMGGDFVKFGTAPWTNKEGCNMCHVFMNIDQELTDVQISWLEQNLVYATDIQRDSVYKTFQRHYEKKINSTVVEGAEVK